MTTRTNHTTTHADRHAAQFAAARTVLDVNANGEAATPLLSKAIRTTLRHVAALETENGRMRLALAVLADHHHRNHRVDLRDCPMRMCCEIRTALARSFPPVSE